MSQNETTVLLNEDVSSSLICSNSCLPLEKMAAQLKKKAQKVACNALAAQN